MNWIGKIIGAIGGLLLAGPIGLLVGLLVGHLFDQGVHRYTKGLFTGFKANPRGGVLFNTLFQVMGYVAKSDGRVSEKEIAYVQRVMQQMGLDSSLRQEAIHLFTQGKQPHFNLAAALWPLREAGRFQPVLLRSFLETQVEMARADSPVIDAYKQRALENIARELGVLDFQFSSGFYEESSQHQYYDPGRQDQDYRGGSGYVRRSEHMSLAEAYSILGISASATAAEAKQAYRRLMSQNHPDKLMAKGASLEKIKEATQRTQKIKQAYERIRKT
jgi:DnaJ like chaperone protein